MKEFRILEYIFVTDNMILITLTYLFQPLGTRLSPHLLSPFSPHPLSPNQGIVPPFSNPVTPHSLLGGRPALPSIKVTGGGEDNMKLALPRNNRFRRLPVVLSTKENNQLYVPQPDMPGFKMSFLDEADAGKSVLCHIKTQNTKDDI